MCLVDREMSPLYFAIHKLKFGKYIILSLKKLVWKDKNENIVIKKNKNSSIPSSLHSYVTKHNIKRRREQTDVIWIGPDIKGKFLYDNGTPTLQTPFDLNHMVEVIAFTMRCLYGWIPHFYKKKCIFWILLKQAPRSFLKNCYQGAIFFSFNAFKKLIWR